MSELETRERKKRGILAELEKLVGKKVMVFYVVNTIGGDAANFMQYRRVKKTENGKTFYESEPVGTAQVCNDEGILMELTGELLKLKQEIIGEMMQKEADRYIVLDLGSCTVTSLTYTVDN